MEASAQGASRERAELEDERAAMHQALQELERDCQELRSTYDASQVCVCSAESGFAQLQLRCRELDAARSGEEMQRMQHANSTCTARIE